MATREFGHHFQLNHKQSVSIPHTEKHLKYVLKAAKPTIVTFPDSFSLSSKYSLIILDQGNLGSCVVNSFSGIIQSLYNANCSRLYLYFNARVATGYSPTDDSGLDLLQALPILSSFGLVPEINWPYKINMFSKIPPFSNTYKIADTTIPIKYQSVPQNEKDIKGALLANKFIIFGISVYSSFMTNQVAKTGIIPMPNISREANQGGHCIHIVGWCKLNNQTYYIIRNSWGKSWGNDGSVIPITNFSNNGTNGGFAYIPATYVLNPNLAFEFMAIG
jgi:C1A family cysteine protease